MKKAFVVLCLVTTVSAMAAPVPAPRPFPFPVRWSATVDLGGLNELPKALGAKVGEEALELSDGVATREVTTCREYLDARKAGFEAQSTATIAHETWFRSRCRTLEVLSSASGARRSFVRTLALDGRFPSLLPASFEGALSSEEVEAVKAAELLGQSWATFNPRLAPKVIDAETLELRDDENTWVYTLHVLAYGDFNGDRLDDMLIAVSNNADTGSFRNQWLGVVTRRANTGLLELVRRIE